MLKDVTKADLIRNRAAIYSLIFETQKPVKPGVAHLNALANAIMLMQEQRGNRHTIALLGYHVEKVDALIFRDAHTMAALREAHKALTRAIEHMEREEQYAG